MTTAAASPPLGSDSTIQTGTASNYATASTSGAAAIVSEASASQSPSTLHSPLQHQSKSFPPRLNRTPSISSQSSIDSTPTRHSVNDIITLFRQSSFLPVDCLNIYTTLSSTYIKRMNF